MKVYKIIKEEKNALSYIGAKENAVEFALQYPIEVYTWDGSGGIYPDTERLNRHKIRKLEKKLADTDYQSIRDSAKAALGNMSDNELADFRAREAQRQEWRDAINKLRD